MKGTTFIGISEESHLEIEYDYIPEGPRIDYDVPPDPEEIEIEKIYLCGIVDIGKGHNAWVKIEITTEFEDIAKELKWDNIVEKSIRNAKEQ